MHLIHIMHWLGQHPHAHEHFAYMRHNYLRIQHWMTWHTAYAHHWRAWLDAYLHTHDRLPGDDLLLGS